MQVPSELTTKSAALEHKIFHEKAEIAARKQALAIFEAELNGLQQAIAVIEAMPDPFRDFDNSDEFAELRSTTSSTNGSGAHSLPPIAPAPALGPVSGPGSVPAPLRNPRRNIPQLVADHLDAQPPGEWIKITDMVSALNVQRNQLEKALEQLPLKGLGDIEWDRDQADVRRPFYEDVVAAAPPPGPEIDPLVQDEADQYLHKLLAAAPLGLSRAALIENGIEYEQLTAGVESGAIWRDDRGFYHETAAE